MKDKIYRNNKSGNEYRILGTATNVSNNVMEEGYLYVENTIFYKKVFFRNIGEFIEKFTAVDEDA